MLFIVNTSNWTDCVHSVEPNEINTTWEESTKRTWSKHRGSPISAREVVDSSAEEIDTNASEQNTEQVEYQGWISHEREDSGYHMSNERD